MTSNVEDIFDGLQWFAFGSTPPVASAPLAPGSISVVPLSSQVQVTTSAPGADGWSPVTGYVWTITPTAGGATTTFSGASASVVSHTFTGLLANTSYTCTVAAVNTIGTGPALSTTALTYPASTQTVLYGPGGQYPANTPAENGTPIATIAVGDWAALITVLRTAPSGSVIHLANGAWPANTSLYDAAAYAHLATLAQNVLIRPVTIGGAVIAALSVKLCNVTFMYVEVTGDMTVAGNWNNSGPYAPANRVRMARIKVGPNSTTFITAPGDDIQLVEVVAPTRGVSGNDRLHLSPIPQSTTWPTSGHGHFSLTNTCVVSCWWVGMAWDGSAGHTDTMQITEIPAGTIKMTNTYIGPCGNSSNMQISPDGQDTAPAGLFWMDTCYVDVPGAFNGLLLGQYGTIGYSAKVNNCEINNFRLAYNPQNPQPNAGINNFDISGNKFAQGVNSSFPNNTYGAVLTPPTFVPPSWWW